MTKNLKNIESFYPLSPMQHGMLFHSLYAPESGVYFEQLRCTLRGELDIPAFKKAWQRLMERHSILRSAFIAKSTKEPVQVVNRDVPISISVQDWRDMSSEKQEAALESFEHKDRTQGFDLAKPPLMRLTLLRTSEIAYYFIWSYHHLLLDGWSVPIILQEVMTNYDKLRQGREIRLPAARPYRDYIVWLKKQDTNEAEAYWRRSLQGFTAPTPLVVDRILKNDGVSPKNAFKEYEIWLDGTATADLQSMARKCQLTPNTILQGAWALLLSRYSFEEDVLFGATVSGRPAELEGVESMVGLFINTLPVRVRVPPNKTALAFLKELQANAVEMRQYEYSSLVQIQGWSDVPRGIPMFESILVFENFPTADSFGSNRSSLEIQDLHSVEQTNYPLALISGLGEKLMLKIAYDANRFDATAVSRILGHLEIILKIFADDVNQPLAGIPSLTDAERQELLVEWNNTAIDHSLDLCIHQWFEAQAELTPDADSVVFEDQRLSYAELNRQANQLAHSLRKLNVAPEVVVGICAEKSPQLVIGLLGILKAGGAYLPLDPTLPPERLGFMLEDSQASVLLSQTKLLDRVPISKITSKNPNFQVLLLDGDEKALANESTDNPVVRIDPDNLAYVIYTSGSTGKPKGTMLQHRSVNNLIHTVVEYFRIEPDSRVLQFASIGFDASVTEIFPTFSVGATLCLPPQGVLTLGPDLKQLLISQAVSIATLPPSLLSVLSADELPALKTIISAGEQCSWDIVSRWSKGRRFLNGYGPTETTVAASYFHAQKSYSDCEAGVPIGRPIPNTQIYLLDRHFQPTPVGVPGELHVGGVSLARAYINRPGLTADRFIPNPFSERTGERLYKTGDLVRRLPDGNLEFLGRIDHQVKLRGFRIELGEIETALAEHPAVKQVFITVREETTGDKRLVAYIVLDRGHEPVPAEWQGYLKEKLPEYMIPSAFVCMDALPMNTSGKVDRGALPAPGREESQVGREIIAPRDNFELQVARIWEDLFNIPTIGVKDNFFELGGHSLLAIRLLAQIQKKFEKEISLVSFFQEPTVEYLAAVLRRQDDEVLSSSLVPLQAKGDVQPLFFVHPSGGSVHWYAELARKFDSDQDQQQPFYGFQAQGLNGGQPIHEKVEDMAAHFVKTLREFQSEGPYHLGSWSMGVVIAYEMALQLQDQGHKVGLLAMLDQGPVLPTGEPEDDAAYLVDVFGKHLPLSLEHLRQLTPRKQLAHVWKTAREGNWIYPDVTLDQFKGFVHRLRIHTEAWRQYTPRLYSGKITLFRAGQQPEDGSQEADMGWKRLAVGGVDVLEVPGDHLTILQEPHVQVLAKKLMDCLNKLKNAQEV